MTQNSGGGMYTEMATLAGSQANHKIHGDEYSLKQPKKVAALAIKHR